ncbi:MAG: hypothetical protein KJP08_03520 [Gammaproteobacteria bacterium]|nr:hypothetical protein [Gammaproteobacteria bacterium]NNF49562.1 hypothetical protein [Woeseiaceae bacterium]MBT8093856.1 hypothetical protein [Gammaproteobacteria bacterium]MBT8105953.1 hypothetical protein [Gammaproteobacteria bacterium]NNK25967.1 hypothetical protein [Woeseiaceae bacterium]
MIQQFASASRLGRRRGGAALLLAVLLNLALVPCTMALEVAEDSQHAHDCCPPKPQLDTSECCDVDEASVSTRGDRVTPDNDLAQAVPAEVPGVAAVAPKYAAAADPPDPPEPHVALHKLHCVYLK